MNEQNCREKLAIILSFAAKIAQSKDIDTILFELASMGKNLIASDRSTVWLINREKNLLWTKIATGMGRTEIPVNSGVVGETVRIGKPIISNSPYELPFFNPEVDKKTGYKTRSLLTLPLFNDTDEVIGAFQCVNKVSGEEVFTNEDLELLNLLAGYAQKALINALLTREIEKTQTEIIMLMSEIGESRSKETGNHVKRVTLISKELAKLAGLSETEVKLVEAASPMHDIGKVAIADSILNKPGKLTEEEFRAMQTHTSIGHQLLSQSRRPIIKAASIIAHEHHEKYNGSGYPRGLQGEEIHIYGRITAIADVFDALASKRCYKEAWDLARVKEHFKNERGEHFDPDLSDIFLKHFDFFSSILQKYRDEF